MKRWISTLLLSLAGACAQTSDPPAGSQTHFLLSCDHGCAEPYACVCGVCTLACTQDSTCAEASASAACVAAMPGSDVGACDAASKICDVECTGDRQCAALSGEHVCSDGRCRVPREADGGSSDSGGGAATGGTGGTGGTDAGPASTCDPACPGPSPLPGAAMYLKCCDGTCSDTGNDQYNCGGCGNGCEPATPFCDYGSCKATPCTTSCDGGECCGTECCGAGETCCNSGGPVGPQPRCTVLAEGQSCPHACYDCMCASPSTPIATPSGERFIADLAVGDLVYSVDHEATVAVPILRVNRTAVRADHRVLRVTLSNGRVLEVSAGHPLSTGDRFDDLQPGSMLDEVRVLDVRPVPYEHAFTYDILPGSDTGTYFAAGVEIGSTLSRR